ncbi:VOC family protein [Nocardia sp. NPDC050793]|uniref:VOC family protein n=1 Tax=Nocardia sp. NPDC050793 TaxID=3155159 RepID=UPI0033E57C12
MTNHITAVHHTGILTRDLDGLENVYRAMGFTLSPRSRHLLSALPGEAPQPGCTANLCALFGGSYIELLGIVDESAPDPWHTKAMADRYEGFRILNLDTDDAAATHDRLAALGMRTSGMLDLERDVDTADGPRTVRARAVHLDPRTTPEGYVGLAQHLTREYVHQPRYLAHPNGARGIAAVLIVAADDEYDEIARRYAELLGAEWAADGPLSVLEHEDVRLELLRTADVAAVLPGEPAPAPSYLAAMTIRVADVAEARGVVERGGIPTRDAPGGFFVSGRDAYGAGLFFTAG